MHKIAVLGGGYAGLAVCWHLLQKNPHVSITLFDSSEEFRASSISTGLLHLYPGEHARRSLEGDSAFEEAISLLEVSSHFLGKRTYERKSVFRPAIAEEQKVSFFKTASLYPDVDWWDSAQVEKALPDLIPFPGLFIPAGIAVDSALYLEGLLGACMQKGVRLEKIKIQSLEELAHFDSIIVAAGWASLQFPEFHSIPLSITKGQMLLCRLPEGKKLPFSIGGKGHISHYRDDLYFLGSTYERDYADGKPHLEKALELKELVAAFFPAIKDAEVIECRSAFRIAQKASYLPFMKKVTEKIWLYTGLGSRGLLYHALFAKNLAENLLTSF